MRLLFGWIKTWFVLWGKVKPGSFYIFPQGLMWICFPSATWHHLHPKYFLGIIFPRSLSLDLRHFIGAWYFLCHSNPSVLSVRWIQVYPWFFWLVMEKHQVYVTIKLPPRSKLNRGITSISPTVWEIIWFDDWAGFTKIHQKMCHVWDVFCNKCPPSLIMIRYANIMMKNHCLHPPWLLSLQSKL